MAVIGVEQVEAARRTGAVLRVARGDLITPLARERARDLLVSFDSSAATASSASAICPAAPRTPDAAAVNGLYRRGAPTPALPSLRAASARPRAAVIGAGHVGAVAAMRLAESDLFDEVVLTDIVEGLAAGIALDLWHAAGLCRSTTRITGSDNIDSIAGCNYVIITAGKPRRPGMSRTDLTAVNAEIVGAVSERIAVLAPNSVVVVVSNPLEEMTHVAALRTGFPPERVLGMAGVLDTARFTALVGLTGKRARTRSGPTLSAATGRRW